MRGKAIENPVPMKIFKDHPRLCGEKDRVIVEKIIFEGSPPPMRGKGDTQHFAHLPHGITPAYAGKRYFVHSAVSRHEDHPRLCGEKCCFPFIPFHSVGSPPPMRGKVFRLMQASVCTRITPAYAGKRSVRTLHSVPEQDHPRLCGEK
mgnify:CR=1 FL=1